MPVRSQKDSQRSMMSESRLSTSGCVSKKSKLSRPKVKNPYNETESHQYIGSVRQPQGSHAKQSSLSNQVTNSNLSCQTPKNYGFNSSTKQAKSNSRSQSNTNTYYVDDPDSNTLQSHQEQEDSSFIENDTQNEDE